MKKYLTSVVLVFILFLGSCSSDDFDSICDDSSCLKDSVNVTFVFPGDWNQSEQILEERGLVQNPRTYYHIQVKKIEDESEYISAGYIGLFSDLKFASIRLLRGTNYLLKATAIKESEERVDVTELSTIYKDAYIVDFHDTINIYNHYSDYIYYKNGGNTHLSGAIEHPVYEDHSVHRYYGEREFQVNSNETVELKLKQFFYKLHLEVDPPIRGSVVISSVEPSLSHKICTNDAHLSVSHIYSLGGWSLSNASKEIELKLEFFNDQGNLTSVSSKKIIVKPNVESIIKISFDQQSANNSLDIMLDQTPMQKEEFVW